MNDSKVALADAWRRLDALCVSLWKDNSPRAVEAQALLEEFRSEMTRFDSLVTQAHERIRQSAREHDEAQASLRANYEAELAGAKKRLEVHEKLIRDKDSEISRILAALNESERKNADFHAHVLKSAAESEEALAQKMETLYKELKAKESSLEDVWQRRQKALELDAQHSRDLLNAKQSELDAWEKRRLGEEDSLKKRATDLEIRSQQLQQEYRLKQQEIEQLKDNLQRSISELVRQYQARLKGEPVLPAARS